MTLYHLHLRLPTCILTHIPKCRKVYILTGSTFVCVRHDSANPWTRITLERLYRRLELALRLFLTGFDGRLQQRMLKQIILYIMNGWWALDLISQASSTQRGCPCYCVLFVGETLFLVALAAMTRTRDQPIETDRNPNFIHCRKFDESIPHNHTPPISCLLVTRPNNRFFLQLCW